MIVVQESTVDKVQTKGKQLTNVNQYKIAAELGKGAFGSVYRAVDENNETVAIKVMEKAELVENLLGRGLVDEGQRVSKQPGRCCATGCEVPAPSAAVEQERENALVR